MTELEIRFATPNDAEGILLAHHSAIHLTASKDYPLEIIEEWSSPVTHERIQNYIEKSLPNETTVVAVINGTIAGFGAIVESINELRAVYVAAEYGGIGVGSRLLKELEKIAIERGCPELQMHASLTAFRFYTLYGYKEIERATHTLRSGRKMASVKMHKFLR